MTKTISTINIQYTAKVPLIGWNENGKLWQTFPVLTSGISENYKYQFALPLDDDSNENLL